MKEGMHPGLHGLLYADQSICQKHGDLLKCIWKQTWHSVLGIDGLKHPDQKMMKLTFGTYDQLSMDEVVMNKIWAYTA